MVLPVSRPAIEDGAVLIAGHRIESIGRWAELKASARKPLNDLGEVIVLPGLVNSHCHLDYTDMAGRIPPPKVFSEWIKAIVALKAQWSYSDFALSWVHGAKMLLTTGTTTVGDVEAVPELLPQVWESTPLRVHSFREMISLKNRPLPAALLDAAQQEWDALSPGQDRLGLSPHAPYTTTSELLRLAARLSSARGWRLTTHVAESEPEFDMFTERRGPLFEWLQNQRDMSDCGQGSPVQHLERAGYLSERLLAVHANYLAPGDAALLAKRQVSVVHCPSSHAYFGHRPFPYGELAEAGVNLCLGTDSLASGLKTRRRPPELSMTREMRCLSEDRPGLSPATILRMATMHGATALGQKGEVGELSPRALADLIVIPFQGRRADAEEAVTHFDGSVAGSMIGGSWAVSPSEANRSDPQPD